MPEGDPVSRLQALDAIASERDAVLAFRVCEETGDLEPVFLRIFSANPGEEREAALISIDDQRGMSLGRYLVPREKLDAAIVEADDVDATEERAPETVPVDWGP